MLQFSEARYSALYVESVPGARSIVVSSPAWIRQRCIQGNKVTWESLSFEQYQALTLCVELKRSGESNHSPRLSLYQEQHATLRALVGWDGCLQREELVPSMA